MSSHAGISFGRGVSFVPCGNDAELLLPREGLLAQLVPAAVELALVFVDPFLRRVVRGVRRAGGEVHEERLVRRERLLALTQAIAWSVMSVVK